MDNLQYQKEIKEAIDAADSALYYLRKAEDALNSAGNWGLADMFGGGLITTFVKHSKMDEAEQSIEQARNALQSFSKELRDIDQHMDTYIQVDEFLRFADYFFDNIITDWMVQSKIETAKTQVQQVSGQVSRIRGQLRSMIQ